MFLLVVDPAAMLVPIRMLGASMARPRSQFFTVRTNAKPVNNIFIFYGCGKLAYKWVCLLNFVTELAYGLSTNHSQKNLTSERASYSDPTQRNYVIYRFRPASKCSSLARLLKARLS